MTLEQVREEISDHLDAVKRLFKPGVRVTILVRTPDFPDGSRDLVLTDDDLDAALSALSRRKLKERDDDD